MVFNHISGMHKDMNGLCSLCKVQSFCSLWSKKEKKIKKSHFLKNSWSIKYCKTSDRQNISALHPIAYSKSGRVKQTTDIAKLLSMGFIQHV